MRWPFRSWHHNWEDLATYFSYPAQIWYLVYNTKFIGGRSSPTAKSHQIEKHFSRPRNRPANLFEGLAQPASYKEFVFTPTAYVTQSTFHHTCTCATTCSGRKCQGVQAEITEIAEKIKMILHVLCALCGENIFCLTKELHAAKIQPAL